MEAFGKKAIAHFTGERQGPFYRLILSFKILSSLEESCLGVGKSVTTLGKSDSVLMLQGALFLKGNKCNSLCLLSTYVYSLYPTSK